MNVQQKNLKLLNNKIISTGGGVVKRESNIKSLRANGVIIFIDRDINNIKTDGDVESGYSYIIAPNGNYYELNVYDNNSVAFSPTNKPSKNIILADPNTQDVFLIIKKEYFDNNSTIHFSFLKERSNVILDY